MNRIPTYASCSVSTRTFNPEKEKKKEKEDSPMPYASYIAMRMGIGFLCLAGRRLASTQSTGVPFAHAAPPLYRWSNGHHVWWVIGGR